MIIKNRKNKTIKSSGERQTNEAFKEDKGQGKKERRGEKEREVYEGDYYTGNKGKKMKPNE